MSKIGEKTAGETLNQLKDTYQQRERDLEARRKDEVRELTESHQTEVARLRKENQQRIQSLQDENITKLSQKDLQYQKEIEAMRTMYTRKVMSDSRASKKSSTES